MLFDLMLFEDLEIKIHSVLAHQQRKTLSIHRCTCPECGLICASTSTGKLKQHLSKTCLRRQQEIRERGIEASDLCSPETSEFFTCEFLTMYFLLV